MQKTRMFFLPIAMIMLVVLVISCTTGTSQQQNAEADVPLKAKPEADGGVSYMRDIQPIFNEYCVSCHGQNKSENDLRLDSYDDTMKGGNSGPVIIPGWPEASTLVYVMRRKESDDIAMPYHGRKLTPNRIKNVMTWVESGAPNN